METTIMHQGTCFELRVAEWMLYGVGSGFRDFADRYIGIAAQHV